VVQLTTPRVRGTAHVGSRLLAHLSVPAKHIISATNANILVQETTDFPNRVRGTANANSKNKKLSADVQRIAIGWDSTVLAMTTIPVRAMVNVTPTLLVNATIGLRPAPNIGAIHTVTNAKTIGMVQSVKCTAIQTTSTCLTATREERSKIGQMVNK